MSRMNERNYLPGTIRERLQELMKRRHIKQADLAEKIGVDNATLSRFINGKTDKISPDAIVRMAKEFEVSTDFLLGVVNDPARKNYDIGEIGLTVDAARNLYTGKVNADVVNRLLTNDRFADTADQIALYLEDRLARGVAAQNEIYGLAYNQLKKLPEAKKDADEIHSWISNPHRDELNGITSSFEAAVREIKKEYGSDSLKETQIMSREITREIFAEVMKGRDAHNPKVTAEECAGVVTQVVANRLNMPEEKLGTFRKLMLMLMDPFGRKAASGQSSD